MTRQVLTQIILDQETKSEGGALPLPFLRQVISCYGRGAEKLLPDWLENSMKSFVDTIGARRSDLPEEQRLAIARARIADMQIQLNKLSESFSEPKKENG